MRAVVVNEIARANGLRMTQRRTVEMRGRAVHLVHRFHKDNRQDMPSGVGAMREALIVAIMKGVPVARAFEECAGVTAGGASLLGRVRVGSRKALRDPKRKRRRGRRPAPGVEAVGRVDTMA